ncbi:hypothetical protein DYB35_011562 [Aphanomyces astaci]|uniref:Uncharacterized protein n=1 Tax=Aphanomyces astaci TaxID=112090 RepID=A0A418DT30_APHAT|nr:hypothetical protein DYB35_011562 [Aphanomyces astaci]
MKSVGLIRSVAQQAVLSMPTTLSAIDAFGPIALSWKTASGKTTFALTNFNLSLLPLRAEDENYYAMVLACYQRMASEKKRKRAETQRCYQLSREGRIAMDTIHARFSPYRG